MVMAVSLRFVLQRELGHPWRKPSRRFLAQNSASIHVVQLQQPLLSNASLTGEALNPAATLTPLSRYSRKASVSRYSRKASRLSIRSPTTACSTASVTKVARRELTFTSLEPPRGGRDEGGGLGLAGAAEGPDSPHAEQFGDAKLAEHASVLALRREHQAGAVPGEHADGGERRVVGHHGRIHRVRRRGQRTQLAEADLVGLSAFVALKLRLLMSKTRSALLIRSYKCYQFEIYTVNSNKLYFFNYHSAKTLLSIYISMAQLHSKNNTAIVFLQLHVLVYHHHHLYITFYYFFLY